MLSLDLGETFMRLHQILTALALIACASGPASSQTPRATSSSQTSRATSEPNILAKVVAPCFTRTHDDEPNECVHIEHISTTDFLLDSLNWQRIPVGVALLPDDDGHTRFDFAPTGQTVQHVLDAAVATDPRYQWTLEKGVVNLTPRAGVPTLLDVRLSRFNRENAIPDVLFESLAGMPAVRDRAVALGFTGPHWFAFRIGLIDTRKSSIDCRDCTVRDVLNEIVRQSGGTWMYREFVNGKERTYYFGAILG
jgi:hypothetical protein